MTPDDFDRTADALRAFHRRFAPLFGRREAQQRSEQYLRGLLVQQAERRNAENLAEAISGATPRALQRFLSEAPWPTDPVIAELQAYLAERLSDPAGIFVLDETGFPKQGRHSVGVARQYSGTLGKIGNCQVGVFLAYVAPGGHALIDRQLYLPRAWADDAERCRAAGVPASVTFQTKADLGLAMLDQARAREQLAGVWVTADEQYGQVPSFRDALAADGWWYVLEVPTTSRVFDLEVATEIPAAGRCARTTAGRCAGGEPPSDSLAPRDGGTGRPGSTHLSVRGPAGLGESRHGAECGAWSRLLGGGAAQSGRQRTEIPVVQRAGGNPAAHAGGRERATLADRERVRDRQRRVGAG